MRLFCIPYAGGGASTFFNWPSELPADVEVCSVQLPGRESRYEEQLSASLTQVTTTLGEAIAGYRDIPFALFGHSMGALIAFELARELHRQRAPEPIHLFVSGRRAPHLPEPRPPIHHLSDDDFVAELQRYAGIPDLILQDRDLLGLFLPILRADFELVAEHRYAPADPLDCPITAFGGLQDPNTSRGELEAWHVHTTGSFSLQMFPGDHFFIRTARSRLVGTIAEDLSASRSRPLEQQED